MKKLINTIVYNILMFILVGTQTGKVSAALQKAKNQECGFLRIMRCLVFKLQGTSAQVQLIQGINNTDVEKVEKALAAGADANEPDSFGNRPLKFAVITSSCKQVEDELKIIELLVEHGADVNQLDGEGRTPIMNAICRSSNTLRQVAAVQLLIVRWNANVLIRDVHGKTAIEIAQDNFAAGKASVEVGQKLIKLLESAAEGPPCAQSTWVSDISAIYSTDQTISCHLRMEMERIRVLAQQQLFDGIKDTDVNEVREAIAAGADVNQQDSYGNTPLGLAVFPLLPKTISESLKMIALLLRHGADINKKGKDGATPILNAITFTVAHAPKQLIIVKFLIENGASVLARDLHGNTPLQRAKRNLTHSLPGYTPADLKAGQDLVILLEQAEQQQRQMRELTSAVATISLGDDGSGIALDDGMNC